MELTLRQIHALVDILADGTMLEIEIESEDGDGEEE